MKNKQELLDEAGRIAKLHQQKKAVVISMLDSLDKEEKMSSKHLEGIASVNELMKEVEILEKEHSNILEQIKGK